MQVDARRIEQCLSLRANADSIVRRGYTDHMDGQSGRRKSLRNDRLV